MEDSNKILSLIEDTEYLLEDILLSGFHSIQASSLEKLQLLKNAYSKYDMDLGKELIQKLYDGLTLRKNSFDYNINNITDAYCSIEFYTKNAKSKLK